MGFTIGTPLNYMMLAKTKEREANSALATLSLVRSVGTAVAPAVLVAFIAHAGTVDEGFRGAFLLVGICSLVGLALLALYREDRPRPGQAKGEPTR